MRIFAALTVAGALALGAYYLTSIEPAIDEREPEASSDASVATTVGVVSTITAAVEEPPTGPQMGGTVRVGTVGEPGSLNLLLATGDRALLALENLVAAAAVRLDPDTHDLIPGVFDPVPTLGGGGLVIDEDGTMVVRAEIAARAMWSSGRLITGEDILHTYNLIEAHRDIVRADLLEAHDKIVPGSVVVEDGVVEFRLTEPTLALDRFFSVIVPEYQVPIETFPIGWDNRLWASAGPFMVTSVSGSQIELARNDRYGRTDADGVELPYLDGLTLVLYPTAGALVEAFDRGDVEIVGAVSDPVDVASLDAVEGATTEIRRGPGWEHLSFQFGPGALAVNPESVVDRASIRSAIYAAIDRQAVAEAAQGGYGIPMESITALGWPTLGGIRIWGERDAPDGLLIGVTVVLSTTGDDVRTEIVDVVRSSLEAEGATVHVVTDEAGRFFGNQVLPGSFEVAEWAWLSSHGPGGTTNDLMRWYTAMDEDSLDFAQWATHDDAAPFLALTTGLDSLLNPDDLAERLLAAEQALADAVPVIPLYADLNVGAAYDVIGGFTHSALPGGVTSGAANWWRRDA